MKLKNVIITVIIAVLIINFLFILFYGKKLELMAYDLKFNLNFRKPDSQIVIVAASKDSDKLINAFPGVSIGKFPWERKVWADLLKIIAEQKPEAIVLDLAVLNEGQNSIDDTYFLNTIKDIPNLYFANYFDYSVKQFEEENKDLNKLDKKILQNTLLKQDTDNNITKFSVPLADNTLSNNNIQSKLKYLKVGDLLPGITSYAKGIGFTNITPDSDKVNRRLQLIYKFRNKYYLSLPLAVKYNLSKTEPDIELTNNGIKYDSEFIPFDNDLKTFINWRSGKNKIYKYYPFHQVYLQDKFEDYDTARNLFKDKIVIVGTTGDIAKDTHLTTLGAKTDGILIQATMLDSLLNDILFITEAPLSLNILSCLILAVLAGLIIWKVKSTINRLALFTGLLFIYYFIDILLFTRIGLNNILVIPIFMAASIFVGALCIDSFIDKERKMLVESVFSRYVSPQVYKTLLNTSNSLTLEAQNVDATILFADIRGFTPLVESLRSKEVGRYLNEYFEEIVSVILKHNGTVDKFMGDAIMAIFGAPVKYNDHARSAVLAALDMQKALDSLNNKWQKQDRYQFQIGIGINTGEVLVGNFGSSKLMDYTALGDAVNVAARLEQLNKEENTTIIISAFTYQYVKDIVEVNILGPRLVKGKSEPIVVYEVTGLKEII